ncbi:hypothetical protein [Thermoflavimicrobium daqui]|jgi:hypothetical protein|uniref:Uncharacterized protein n=1 Tax=Thermoflavimicrobium daqui TaxID=2137476 RepID=A0A364K585_9BACL|nr:hypothetical protein [Thermoflavimicrobium daqui]RAL24441.1 hypothetical protein DL897_08950 [Thermoflavimicrobium daqui]
MKLKLLIPQLLFLVLFPLTFLLFILVNIYIIKYHSIIEWVLLFVFYFISGVFYISYYTYQVKKLHPSNPKRQFRQIHINGSLYYLPFFISLALWIFNQLNLPIPISWLHRNDEWILNATLLFGLLSLTHAICLPLAVKYNRQESEYLRNSQTDYYYQRREL